MKYPIRPSSLSERKLFYEEEFDLKKVKNFISNLPKFPRFYVIPGRKSKICKEELKSWINNPIEIKVEKIEDLKRKALEYLPEGIYYSRDFGEKGYELVIDIDAPRYYLKSIFGILYYTIFRKKPKKWEKYFEKVKEDVKKLYDILKSFGFKKIKIVYSGEGFHVHILDKKAYFLSKLERKILIKEILANRIYFDYPLFFKKVHLIRLPYSLNGIVSRIVIEVDINELDEFNLDDPRIIPKFLINSEKS